MAVSLPTSADVRKARTQATKTVNSQFDLVKTPLLAWVGAGDLAYTKVTEAVESARSRAAERRAEAAKRREKFQAQVRELPSDLRETLTTEELRKRYEEATSEARKYYTDLADRGEAAVEKFRSQPQVKKVLDTVSEANTELEKRVDKAVDDFHDAGEEVLGRVSTQTRSVGEKAARETKKLADEASEAVTEASQELTEAIDEAGADAATTTRSVTRKAANRTAPKKPAAKATNGTATKK
jgi:heparin binding hemagglutinin HbhA